MGSAKREWEKMLEADPDYPTLDDDNWWKQQDLEQQEEQESNE